MVVQPVDTRPFEMGARNVLGQGSAYTGLVATFRLAALEQIRALDKNREFLVIVIATAQREREFKIKAKHFPELR